MKIKYLIKKNNFGSLSDSDLELLTIMDFTWIPAILLEWVETGNSSYSYFKYTLVKQY